MSRNGDILIVVREYRLINHHLPLSCLLTWTDDFTARTPDELDLKRGDRIELIERDDEFGDGWFLGKHVNSTQTGLFPESRLLFSFRTQ